MSRCSCGAERRALQDPLPHVRLAHQVDLVLEEIAQRAADRVETLLAVAALDRAVVDVVAKFDIGIERAGRLAPSLGDVNAELGGQHVADDQRVGVETVGWEWAELVLPQPHQAARAELQRHQAQRRDGVTLHAAIGCARPGIELRVEAPDLTERQVAPVIDRRRRRHHRCRPSAEHPSARDRSGARYPR